MIRQSLFANGTGMMVFQPNLKAGKAEQMAAFSQSANIKSALTYNTESFLIHLILPRFQFLQISTPSKVSRYFGFKLSLRLQQLLQVSLSIFAVIIFKGILFRLSTEPSKVVTDTSCN